MQSPVRSVELAIAFAVTVVLWAPAVARVHTAYGAAPVFWHAWHGHAGVAVFVSRAFAVLLSARSVELSLVLPCTASFAVRAAVARVRTFGPSCSHVGTPRVAAAGAARALRGAVSSAEFAGAVTGMVLFRSMVARVESLLRFSQAVSSTLVGVLARVLADH